jgi:hypothetical protein
MRDSSAPDEEGEPMGMKSRLWLISSVSVVMAVGVALAASGTLGLGPPWGGADFVASSDGGPGIEVTYAIKAGKAVPQAAVDAVIAGIDAWNTAIDSRESSWFFDLVPFGGGGSSSSGGPPSFSHKPGHNPPGQGGGKGGKGDGGEPDITIQIKKGGGRIAGSAQRTVDASGFVVKVKIQISGSAFGLENDADTITEVAMHELGHALALGHHSNELDLMGRTVGYEGGGPSGCDLKAFLKAHEWLTVELGAMGPYRVSETSVACP